MTSQITITGNVTGDPELRFTGTGKAVAEFTVAVGERKKDGNEWVDDGATFYRCSAWEQMAENVAESLTKGMRVVVVGGLRNREYEKRDGGKGWSLEVRVDDVGTSLRWATAKVTRSGRSDNTARQQAPAGDPWGAAPRNEEPPF